MQTISLKDAFGFAINLEKSGREFYTGCGKNARKEDAQKVFFFLADEEKKHCTIFERMSARVEQDGGAAVSDERAEQLLDAYAEAFFPGEALSGEKPLKKVNTIDAIGFAVKMELNSIGYYKRLRSVIPEEDRDSIDLIMNEEQQHYEQLNRLKESLQRSGK